MNFSRNRKDKVSFLKKLMVILVDASLNSGKVLSGYMGRGEGLSS